VDKTSLSLLDRVSGTRDEQAWRLLADAYTPLLQGWLRRYGVQPADADDLTQDVLLVVSRELPAFEHNGRTGAFRAWLRGILVNRVRYFWRSRQQRPLAGGESDLERALTQLEDPHSALSREWDREHDRHVVQEMLTRLEGRFDPSTLAAFRHVAIDGHSPEQAGQSLGLSPNAIVIAKCRVLKALRQEAQGLID
jgi:RNA polymerase sigma-70 factor (ECF subfamily)